MFGVLEIILCHDPVPGQSFGAGQGQKAFIVSLCVLNVSRLGARDSGRFISPERLGSSGHSVSHTIRIWASRRAADSSSEMNFMLAAPAEARRSFEELSSYTATKHGSLTRYRSCDTHTTTFCRRLLRARSEPVLWLFPRPPCWLRGDRLRNQ